MENTTHKWLHSPDEEQAGHILRVWVRMLKDDMKLHQMAAHEQRCFMAAYRIIRTLSPNEAALLQFVFGHKRRYYTLQQAVQHTVECLGVEFNIDEPTLLHLTKDVMRRVMDEYNFIES